MWEDNRKKTLIKNLFLLILILALVAGLLYAVLYVRRTTAEHDAQLTNIQAQQQQEQTVARQESVAAIQAEYEKDLQTVADYLPGIVCWGDSLTLGASGSISYPYVLQKFIDTYLCDIYDFRSTIENAEDYSRLKWTDYTVGIPVVNMGAGPEDTYTILGRAGVIPYVTAEAVTVPAGTEPIPIRFVSQSGKSVAPLTGGSAGVNDVSIGGITGALEIDASSIGSGGTTGYRFTRSEPGSEQSIPAGTVIRTAATDEYRDYLHIVCVGTYGSYDSADDLVRQTKELLARQTKNTDRYIVLGLCSVKGYTQSAYELDMIDTAMMQAFGNRYINVRKYLSGDGFADAGLSKTYDDSIAISINAVPPSFLSSAGSVELNGKANRLIGELIFRRMDSLGYFDEINEELSISETTKQILKDDPQYFTRIIENTIK